MKNSTHYCIFRIVLLPSLFLLFLFPSALAQLSINQFNSGYTVTFDGGYPGINNGAFNGNGFTHSPTAGQINSDALIVNGLSDGDMTFGNDYTTGDYTRGTTSGGETTGGIYAADVGAGNMVLAFQPTDNDLTEGSLVMKLQNNAGNPITELVVEYTIYEYNDQNRSNYIYFKHSSDNVAYTQIASLNYFTTEASTGGGWTATQKTTTITGLSIANGDFYYLQWETDDNSGSGSRDEIALDDIGIIAHGSAIAVSKTSISGFETESGAASPTQTYSISGLELTGDVSVTAPALYEISTDNNNFFDFMTLPVSGGNVAGEPKTIYARIKNTAPVGAVNGTITHTAPFAQQENISLDGRVICGTTKISSFSPIEASEDAIITISGSGFNDATAVKINGTPVTSYQIVSDTKITAILPNTTTGKISITDPTCTAYSNNSFVVLNTRCNAGTNLLISEICDPTNENNYDRYIEVYNPTNSTINITNWTVEAITNCGSAPTETWYLSGSITPGNTKVCGHASASFPVDFHSDTWHSVISGSYFSWNGQNRDGVKLKQNTTLIDYIEPTDCGVSTDGHFTNSSLVRKPGVCSPNTTYTPGSWIQTVVGDAGNGASTPGVHSSSCRAGTPPAISQQPISQTACKGETITFSVNNNTAWNYQWKVHTGGSTWNNVGDNSNILILSNVTTSMSGYQYYCEVDDGSGNCSSVSKTVQLTVNPLPANPQNSDILGGTFCGGTHSFQLVASPVPTGETWYWQTTSGANSTVLNASNPFGSYTNGTHSVYLRARNNTTGCWSSGQANAGITVHQLPVNPPPASGSGTYCTAPQSFTGGGESGNIRYYWQDNTSGKSFALGYTNTYPVSTTASMYLQSYNTTTSCWAGNVTSAATITIGDFENPVANCRNTTLLLDVTGNATLNPVEINNNSHDNCTLPPGLNFTADITTFNCSDIGANTVTLTVKDAAGHATNCQATVTVEDQIPPDIVVKNITVDLDKNGYASITASDVNNGTSDACGLARTKVLPKQFNCNNLGKNEVTLTAHDINGNTAVANCMVTVRDKTPPDTRTKNITISLDNNGFATIAPSDVDNNSSDNCSIAHLQVTPFAFNCNHTGNNQVQLVATDKSGNSSTASATVKIYDYHQPVALVKHITIPLDEQGYASITADAVDNGTTDNCMIASIEVSPNSFTANNLGINPVTFKATDIHGNVSTAQANIKIIDNIPPFVKAQDISLTLNSKGMALVTTDDIDNGSSDNTRIVTKSLSNYQFDCSQIGINTLVFTASDQSGNTSTATALVTIVDNMPPVIKSHENLYLSLDDNGNASIDAGSVDEGSYDNCSIASLSVTPHNFSCADTGANTVIFKVTDQSGNQSTSSAIVYVQDNTPPVVECKDIAIELDAYGEASIVPTEVDNASSDNCGIVNMQVQQNHFTGNHLGENVITLSAEDAQGNTAFCSCKVTVSDNIPPVIKLQDVDLELNAEGKTSLQFADIDLGTTDNVDILHRMVSPVAFDCNNSGENTINVVVTDKSGNSASATCLATINDNILPEITCINKKIVFCDQESCSASVEIPQPQTHDNCTITKIINDFSNSENATGVYPLGITRINWMVEDIAGNTATCQTQVTVIDNQKPEIECPENITLCTDEGISVATANYPLPVVRDNCSYSEPVLIKGIKSGSAFPVGETTVSYQTSDTSGNPNSCSFRVKVLPASVTPTQFHISNNNTCPDVLKTITLTDGYLGTDAQWMWYEDVQCTQNIGSETDYLSIAPPKNKTYYVRAEGKCNTTKTLAIAVSVKTLSQAPVDITIQKNSTCPDVAKLLEVQGGKTGSDAKWKWYADAGFSTGIGTGKQINWQTTDDSKIWVRAEGSCNTTTPISTMVYVLQPSQAPEKTEVSENSYCKGAVNNITLSYTGGYKGEGATANWYKQQNDKEVFIASGNHLSIAAPAQTTSYLIRFEGICNTTPAITTNVEVKKSPNPPTEAQTSINNFCKGSTSHLTLSYTGTIADNNTIAKWYDNETANGNPVAIGNNQLIVAPQENTTYFVRFENACGHSNLVSKSVTVYDLPVAELYSDRDENTVCTGNNITFTAKGGSNYCFLLNNKEIQNSSDNIFILQRAIHHDRVSVKVTDANGCSTTSKVQTIIVNDLPYIDAGNDITIKKDGITQLFATYDNTYQYLWSPKTGLSSFNVYNPEARVSTPVEYTVTVTDANGCQNYDKVFVSIVSANDIHIYTGFTPNNDGDNDTWKIKHIEKFPDNQVSVFNARGNLVFQTKGYKNDWRGTLKHTNKKLPTGTYYFIIDLGDGSKSQKGAITIIR